MYCYSQAHLLDFKSDFSEKKFDDLQFLRTLVNDNLLFFIPNDGSIARKELPIDAFNAYEYHPNVFSNLLQLVKQFGEDVPLSREIRSQLQELLEREGQLPLLKFEEDRKGVMQFFMTETPQSIQEYVSNVVDFVEEVSTDRGYRALRQAVKKDDGIGSLNISDPLFDEKLSNTVLGKSLIDFTKEYLKNNHQKVDTMSIFTTAYMLLNILAVDGEKNRKAKFQNTYVDAMHSFYGAFCDVFVSDEVQVIKKTKYLYKKLGIQTRVLSLVDFVKTLGEKSFLGINSVNEFNLLLKDDCKNAVITKRHAHIEHPTTSMILKPKWNYFNFFNRLQLNIDEDTKLVSSLQLFKNQNYNYSNFHFYNEHYRLIDNIANVFGPDSRRYHMLEGNEREKIKSGIEKWQGRYWIFDEYNIILDFVNEFGLVLELELKNW